MRNFLFLVVFILSASVDDVEALLLAPPGGGTGTVAKPSPPRLAFARPVYATSSTTTTTTTMFYKIDGKESATNDTAAVTTNNFDAMNANPITTIQQQQQQQQETSKNTEYDCYPGRDENDRFDCDPSVAMWRKFQEQDHQQLSAEDNFKEMNRIAMKFMTMSTPTGGASYFTRHVARTLYFGMNAILGDAAHKFLEQQRNNNNDKVEKKKEETTQAQNGLLPMGMSGQKASRLVLEVFLSYEQDFQSIAQKGAYREPWDMKTLRHRQSNPLNVITQTSRFVREAVGGLGRRSRGTEQDKQVKFFSSKSSSGSGDPSGSSNSKNSNFYPDYYQTAFHYQGDGWMSSDSANVYETSTETLFLGRQDSMQRTSLPPIVELSKKFKKEHGRPMRVLEVACGTGRFMTFVRDNLPLDTEYTALDLSPFYLEKASDNDEYWRSMRLREENNIKYTSQTKTKNPIISPANLVQAQAEGLPFEDNSFDAVLCVYLFHELPRDIRAKAAAEMTRVVSPGGTVVLTDSIQKGDRPALDSGLANFKNMNEPFYIDYINDDLGSHFETEGLTPMTKIVRSTTKSLSFSKPVQLDF